MPTTKLGQVLLSIIAIAVICIIFYLGFVGYTPATTETKTDITASVKDKK